MSGTPARTVLWGQWRKVRWLLIALFLGVAAAYATLAFVDARHMRRGAGDRSEDFVVALLLIAVPCVVAAGSILLVHSDAERLHIALPARVFRLPLATWKLVALMMGFGSAVAAGVAMVSTLPALLFLNVDFGWHLPVFTAVFAMALIQLWAFVFGGAHPRVAAVSFIVCFGGLAWLAQRPVLVELATQTAPVLMFVLLVVQLLAVYAIAVWAVSISRGGGFAMALPSKRRGTGARRARRPFRSRRAAQLWYEWRLFGGLLPVYVTGTAAAYFIGLPLVVGVFRLSNTTGQSSKEPLFAISWFTSAQFVTTGLGTAALIGAVVVGGIMFMRAGHWNSQSVYLLTRPLTIRRIASARIVMVLASTGLTLAILIGLTAFITLLLSLNGEAIGLLNYIEQGYEHLPRLFPLAYMWAGLLMTMWLGAWSVNFVWVLSIVAVVHLPPLALIWGLYLFGGAHPADARLLTGEVVTICNWIASGLLVAGLLWMAYQSDRRRLVHPGLTWIAAVLWLAYSAAFVVYVRQWDIPPGAHEWVTRFPHPVNWSVWVGVSALPIAPLFLQPLLLERARHR